MEECISEGILKDFLIKHRAEVIDVCITGYDEEETRNAIRDENLKRGIDIGRERGIKELVGTVKEFTNSKEKAIESLVKRYELTQETAKEKVEQYWAE